MSPSLSVLLPVHNAQEYLSRLVSDLLEVLPELTSQFDVLILDDASSDGTWEVAHDSAAGYPQVRVLRHSARSGRAGLARMALSHCAGELLLLCDEGCQLDVRDLHKLWLGRDAYDAVVAWPADASRPTDESWTRRMRAWRMRISKQRAATPPSAGYQLLRRRTLEQLRSLPTDRYELLAELTRLGQTWQVVEVRPDHRGMTAGTELKPQTFRSVRVDDDSANVHSAAAQRPKHLSISRMTSADVESRR